jgi:hypothetical protein
LGNIDLQWIFLSAHFYVRKKSSKTAVSDKKQENKCLSGGETSASTKLAAVTSCEKPEILVCGKYLALTWLAGEFLGSRIVSWGRFLGARFTMGLRWIGHIGHIRIGD